MIKQDLVGILSTIDAPLLPYTINALYDKGINNICVFVDSKGFGIKNYERWLERTGRVFNNCNISLSDFTDKSLPFYMVSNHNDSSCIQLIKRLGVFVLINGGTPRKLSKDILASSIQGIVNVHPGILPKYRGCSCVEWAILNGDEVGNTAHFMNEKYDQGPIIKSESYLFSKSATYQDIRNLVYKESIKLMAESVLQILERSLSPSILKQQGAGQEFPPIPDKKMNAVLDIIKSGLHPSMVL